MKKKLCSIIFVATMLVSLFFVAAPKPVQAQFNHTNSDSSGNWLLGIFSVGYYSSGVAYNSGAGSELTQDYYPTLEADITQGHFDLMSIDVTAVKPNGQAVNDLTPTAYLTSPSGNSVSMDNLDGLVTAASILGTLSGNSYITTLAKGTDLVPNGYLNGYDVTTYSQLNSPVGITLNNYWGTQRGVQFKYTLHCDPAVGGIYTMTVHFRLKITFMDDPWYKDVYQTVTYDYVPTHVNQIMYAGNFIPGSYSSVSSPENCADWKADGEHAFLSTACYGCGACIIGRLNAEESGPATIYLPIIDNGYNSHVFVYVSENNNNDWHGVADFYSDACPHYTKAISLDGTVGRFNYIGISVYDDFDPYTANWRILGIDCITVV
jgi:hypothetical protein